MSNISRFVVSARKYRPHTFASVVGQESVTQTLQNAIKNQQLAHAYLFCGPRGVGKTSCARIFARVINCENMTPQGEACGTCLTCQAIQEGVSFTVFELDAASNNSVDDMRELIQQVRIAPVEGKYKVYIIDEVHMLSTAAFNAFLKTLEEPPPYAIFILATTEKHKILPTIISRCQIFDFNRVSNQDIAKHLEQICGLEEIQFEYEALSIIARKSEGSVRDALSLLDKVVSFSNRNVSKENTYHHLHILDDSHLMELVQNMIKEQAAESVLMVNEVYRKGFEAQHVLWGLIELFRNLLMSKDQRLHALLDMNESMVQQMILLGKQCSNDFLISGLHVLAQIEAEIKNAGNKKLCLELAIIKMTYLQRTLQLVANEEGSEKKKLVKSFPFRALSIRSHRSREPEQVLYVEKQVASSPAPTIPNLKRTEDVSKQRDVFSLDQIKKQVALKQKLQLVSEAKMDDELLQKMKLSFSNHLHATQNTSALAFEQASVKLLSSRNVEFTVNSNLSKTLLEHIMTSFTQHLAKETHLEMNMSIRVELTEQMPVPKIIQDSLYTKYQQALTKFPLLKELHDKLRLNLEN